MLYEVFLYTSVRTNVGLLQEGFMTQTRRKLFSVISVVLSLLMVISVISFPTLNANADGSAGTLDDFVERCYTVTLDRPSDPPGFADWKDQLLNGKAVGIEIAYGFLFSREYVAKNKDNDAYLKDLYMLFMGREPDESGYNDWMNKLNSGVSRLEVFAGFANSTEFYNICDSYGITAGRYVMGYDRKTINNVNLYVERMYKICLGRIGDKDGQKNWVEKLIKKEISGSECARSFIFSKEYTNLGLSDAEFVENLYLAMFGRPSDADGKNNWLYGLKNGMTRDEVFAGFANSVEFDNICKAYGIDRGTYTATNKGTFDKDNPNNVPVTPEETTPENPTPENPTPENPTPEEPTPTHTHNYNKKNTDSKYLKSAATCTKAAEYYYSCECGEKDTSKTFTSGSALGHDWDNGTVTQEATLVKDGIKTYSCKHSGCTEKRTETIPCLLSQANVGDIIKYGKYEQDGDYLNGKEDIEWRILSKEDGRVLVISEYGLDSQKYDARGINITWESCDLRYWLNDDFMDTAFSEDEKKNISIVEIENKNNSYYNTPGGDATLDFVFCLSVEEVETYFGEYSMHDSYNPLGFNQKLVCIPTQNPNNNVVGTAMTSSLYESTFQYYGYTTDIIGLNCGDWWLRSPGKNAREAGYVTSFGGAGEYESATTFSLKLVRPAMYIKYNYDHLEHSFSEENTNNRYLKSAATCTEPAVYYYSCECGAYDTEHTFTSGSPLGHDYSYERTDDKYLKSAATHAEPAVYYYSCICGEYDSDHTFTAGSPIPHVFSVKNTDIKYLKSAGTHTEPAVYYYSCECGEYDPDHTFTGVSLAHDFSVENTDDRYLKSAATHAEPAVYYYSCECGEYDPDHTFTYGSPIPHNFSVKNTDSKYLKSAATCTDNAVYYYSCECGEYDPDHTFEKARSSLGHRYIIQSTDSAYLKSAATCTEPAVYYYKCTRCEEHGTSTFTYGEPLGHNFISSTLVQSPTLTELGARSCYCDRCEENVTEAIPCLLSQTDVGSTITYGKYEQDGEASNGKEDIEWRILSKEDGRVLVISEYALEQKNYNDTLDDVTWESCSLRAWLNGDFINNSFTDDEKDKIPSVSLENNNNTYYNIPGGDSTTDKVFILSIEEIFTYFGEPKWTNGGANDFADEKLICPATQQAINNGVASKEFTSDDYNVYKSYYWYTTDAIGLQGCYWWVRLPGNEAKSACIIDQTGRGGEKTYHATVEYDFSAVRPAMYIEYETE